MKATNAQISARAAAYARARRTPDGFRYSSTLGDRLADAWHCGYQNKRGDVYTREFTWAPERDAWYAGRTAAEQDGVK